MNDSLKPNLWRVVNKKSQFTLLKAFSASSDRIMGLCLICHDILIRVKSLRALPVASQIIMKSVCLIWLNECGSDCFLSG